MIYTPQKNPEQALATVVFMVLFGIIGGLYFHKIFMVISLIFWMQYTLVLAILQLVHGSKHPLDSVTGILLNPFFRFLIFETLGIVGLVALLKFNKPFIGLLVLVGWLIFSLNFYIFYKTVGAFDAERNE